MELIALIPMIFLVAVVLAWATKIEIAYLFAPAIFFIVGWEFIFGLLGHLNLGMETLVFFMGLAVILLLAKSRGFRNHFVKSSYAPSTVAFVALSLISLYKSKDWVLSQWDEFTHWGLVVKAMYEYSALGPATPVEMVAEKYPPGIPLFQYFVMDFSAGWREGFLFWGTQLILIAIVVSVLAKSSYKHLSEIALKLFVALAASSVFFNNFDNIYADPVLALSFGFLLILAIQASHLDGRWALILALSAGFVTMTKATGIYFAMAAILINIVATLFTVKSNSERRRIHTYFPALIALVSVVTVWITWRYYANSFGASIVGPSDTIPMEFNSETNQDEVVTSYIGAFFDTYVNPSYSASLTSLYWTIICGVFFVIWAMLNGNHNRIRNIAIGITLLITTAGYFGVILISYLTIFGPGEAANLASYERYIGAWYQGVFYAIIILIVSEFSLAKYFESNSDSECKSNPLSIRKQVSLFLVAFLALASFSSIMIPIMFLRSDQYAGSPKRWPFVPVKAAIESAKMPEESRVWIIAQHTAGYEYYVLRYEMLDAQFGKVPWSIGSPNGDGDIWTDPTRDADKWSQELRDFDYVVLYKTTESFNDEFGSFFDGAAIEENSVYKIVKTESDVSLSKIN